MKSNQQTVHNILQQDQVLIQIGRQAKILPIQAIN